MTMPLSQQADLRQCLRTTRWVRWLCLVGIILNLYSAIDDFRHPTGWWSWLFGALSLLCAGVCLLVWLQQRRLAADVKALLR